MRPLLVTLATFIAVASLTPALANEAYLGTIYVTDAGSGTTAVHNLTAADGGAFLIASRSKLSIQPSANAFVCIDSKPAGVPTCDSTRGTRIDANTLFPTSCSSASSVALPDGGVISCLVSCVPVSGASVTCPVWSRIGDE